MYMLLSNLTSKLGDMTVAQDTLLKSNRDFLKSERKLKVETAVRILKNPMSVRLVRHNHRIMFHLEDLLHIFDPDGPLVSTDLVLINDLVAAAISMFKEILRILKRENEMHMVVQESHLGWKVAQELDKEELDVEEKDSAKILTGKTVASAEKSLMTYQLDRDKTSNHKYKGGASRGRGRGGRAGQVGRGGGKCKGAFNGVSPSGGGKVTKPRNGGCHRCGGPHFVRSCPKPLVKD